VYAPDVQLQARVLAADEPLSVTFALDDGEHVQRDVAQAQPAPGDAASLVFSLGGFDASGEQQSYSFAGLETGLHTLTITSQTATAATERRLHFDMQARAAEQFSWADDVQPIFMDRCAKCHTSGPGHTLDSYELWAADKAAIVAALVELRMPADGPLDPAQIRIIQSWAAGGAAP
jgi:mono/diheme cytochrome c family protein